MSRHTRLSWFILVFILGGSALFCAVYANQNPNHASADRFAAALGTSLSAEQAQKLERQLTKHPDDLTLRSQLLGYYLLNAYGSPTASHARQQHILWIIKHHPEAEIAGSPEASLNGVMDDAVLTEAKRLWQLQVQAHPKSAAVLGNAAAFLLLHDMTQAERLLNQAQALAPDDPRFAYQLGHLYGLRMSSLSGNERQVMAQQALAQYERLQRLNHDEANDYSGMDDLAMTAFEAGDLEKALKYASQLLSWAASAGETPFTSTGNAIHKGNLVMGRLALKAGDTKGARAYLLAAGKTPGSPQLNSFGPNMTLAKELLEKGERDVVVQYFQECASFWEMGQGNLKQWSAEVKAGNIPDFGANLDY